MKNSPLFCKEGSGEIFGIIKIYEKIFRWKNPSQRKISDWLLPNLPFSSIITGGREMKFRKGAEEKCQIDSPGRFCRFAPIQNVK